MKPTDATRASKLTAALFDDQILRLARARRTAGNQAYFPLAPRAGEATYYRQPFAVARSASDFEFPGDGTPAGLIAALAARWRAEGEVELASLAPRLTKIAEALKSERVEGDGTVDILCYTMF